MADKYKDMPETTIGSDRARRINSLHRSVDDLVQEQNKKRLQVSNEISSLTKEQQRLMRELDMERSKFTNETASAYNSVVKSLGKTIQNLSVGVKNITLDTARATSSAIGQYGKAIGEDISINKQNTIAMALSKATPLFGYFAAKFMETGVFRDSARKIKESVGGALSSAGESLKNIFSKKQAAEAEGAMPHLQEGGFVKKGGVVQVHAAEVVTPIDKILKQIDEAKASDISRKLSKTLDTLSEEMVRMETLVGEIHKDRKTILETFLSEYKKARSVQTKSWQDRMLKALVELKVAMIGTASRFQIAWQKTLLQHPTFRAMLMFSQSLQAVITTPLRTLFGIRGGFAGDVRRATSTRNVYAQQTNMLGLIYTRGMTYLRNIEKYTKVTAEALVGEEVSPTAERTYTLYGKIKEFMTAPAKKTPFKEQAFDFFIDSVGADRDTLREAGITSFTDLLTPSIVLKNMGITKEAIKAKLGGVFGLGRAAKEKGKDVYKDVSENIQKLVKLKQAQEDREGPHSPSMAENIARTAEISKERFKSSFEREKDRAEKAKKKRLETIKLRKEKKRREDNMASKVEVIKKETKRQTGLLGGLKSFFKKSAMKLEEWFPIIYGFLGRVFSKILIIGKKIGIALFALTRFLGGGLFKGVGKLLGGYTKGAAGVLGGARGALAGGGIRGLASWGVRGGLRATGAVAGAAGGAIIGGVMSIADMISAIRNPEEFAGGVLTRAFAGFLGGTDTGAKGALHGAMKGGALGAAIGSIVPGFGTAIGGAIGAAAGAILGFVGGKRLSVAIKNTMSGIKDIISAVWNVVKFPFQALKELTKSAYYLLKFGVKKIWKWVDNFLSGPGFIGKIWAFYKNIWKHIFGFFGNIWNSIKEVFGKLNLDALKDAIVNVLFPLPNLIKSFKEIGSRLDGWVAGLPIIGNIYKKVKGGIKSIRSGDMSESLKRALEEKPQLLTESQKEVMSAEEIAKAYANEEVAKQKMIAEEQRKARDAAKKEREAQTKALINQQRNSTTAIITSNVNSSNNIAPGNRRGWKTNINTDMLVAANHQ